MEDAKDKFIDELRVEIKKTKASIARLSKNSSNSLKPLSSDIVSPPKSTDKNRKQTNRAQKGYKRNLCVDFTPDQIDEILTATFS